MRELQALVAPKHPQGVSVRGHAGLVINRHSIRPGVELKEKFESISHRFHPILVAFVWELTQETNVSPLGCLQGGKGSDLGDEEGVRDDLHGIRCCQRCQRCLHLCRTFELSQLPLKPES